jgi:calcineurin-like phosphoesterase family protein
MIHFTGCTHFGHDNIIRLANRPFKSVEEMDAVLIENWNQRVKPTDTVYHLGDFSSWKKDVMAPEDYLKALNGNIIRLQGNHDPVGWGQPYIKALLEGTVFCMMHYPIEEWDGWFRGSLHLHCHTHKSDLISAERRFNVTVEATNYRPISLDEILETTENMKGRWSDE